MKKRLHPIRQGKERPRTQCVFVDVADGRVPHLAPHVRASTVFPIDTVRRTEPAQVEPAALGVGNDGRVDLRRRVGVREEQEAVAVVRRAALRVRGDVPCVVHAGQLLRCGGEADIRPAGFWVIGKRR